MAGKKIYWICAGLEQNVRDNDFLKYGLKLQALLAAETRKDPRFREFKLVNLYSCTKREFERIWQDPTTYGIFWNSHGTRDQGFPQADPDANATTLREMRSSIDLDPRSHVYIVRADSMDELRRKAVSIHDRAKQDGLKHLVDHYDERKMTRLDDGRYEIELKFSDLPRASPNLGFAAFMVCGPKDLKNRWLELMPAGATFSWFPYTVDTGEGSSKGYIDKWFDELHRPRYLLQSLLSKGRSSSTQVPKGKRSKSLFGWSCNIISSIKGFFLPSAQAAANTSRRPSLGTRATVNPRTAARGADFVRPVSRGPAAAFPGNNPAQTPSPAFLRARAGGSAPGGFDGGAHARAMSQQAHQRMLRMHQRTMPGHTGGGIGNPLGGHRRPWAGGGGGQPGTSPFPTPFGQGPPSGMRTIAPGGSMIGDNSIANQIRNQFRPTPQRVSLTPPTNMSMTFGNTTVMQPGRPPVTLNTQWTYRWTSR